MATENLLLTTLTSKIISNTFTYNLLTPNDLPIDAKNMMHKRNIRNGVRNSGPTTDTKAANTAITKPKNALIVIVIISDDAFKYDTPSAINYLSAAAYKPGESQRYSHTARRKYGKRIKIQLSPVFSLHASRSLFFVAHAKTDYLRRSFSCLLGENRIKI